MPKREPIFNIPLVIVAIIGLFVSVHILLSLLESGEARWLVLALSLIPARYNGSAMLLPGGEVSMVTSFITYMFVHGDIVHLAVNALWLLAFGTAIAKRIGSGHFLIFSAFCGLGGILAHLLVHWGAYVPVIGASAAISGQMAGAMRFYFGANMSGRLADIRNDPRSVPRISVWEALTNRQILFFLAIWIGLNILLGLGVGASFTGGQVAWEAHIGGFITGLLIFSLFDTKTTVNSSMN